MRLISATLKCYRIHRELSVEFDASRTLIGGPNEVGKSTLIEGIHRGLFLKAKGTGDLHTSMRSSLHGGHPEVEVRFEAGGRHYTLRKCFRGNNGTTQLIQAGGQTWTGDEAEERLTTLLGCCKIDRPTHKKIANQWAHLWVWQGMAGNDPATYLTSHKDNLLRQLQEVGGSVAMQSALDGRVAARFTHAREQIFGKAGNALARTELAVASKALNEAQSARDMALSRLVRMEEAMAGFEKAEAILQRTRTELEQLLTQRKSLTRRESKVAQLRNLERDQEIAQRAAVEKLTNLEKAEQDIREQRLRLDELNRDLDPKRNMLTRGEMELAGLKERLANASKSLDKAIVETREIRLRLDLATACVTTFEVQSRQQEINKRLERVRTLQAEIAERTRQLHGLPAVDRKGLTELQKIEGSLAQANASLTAMAAEIEILATDTPVQVDDQSMTIGDRRTLTECAVIGIGEAVRIRIHPGGGERLDAAREAVRSLREEFQTALEKTGLESIEQGTKIVGHRELLKAQIDNARAALMELDPDKTERAAAEIQNEMTAAEAEVVRRQIQVEDFAPPHSLEDARHLRGTLNDSFHQAEELERAARANHAAIQGDCTNREKQVASIRESLEEGRQEQNALKTRLDLLLETHGTDIARTRTLEEVRMAVTRATTDLDSTRKELAALQPDLLPADKERLERASAEINRQRESAQTDRAVFQNTLQSDGSEDPKRALAEAEAQLHRASEHHRSVSRKAKAIDRIVNLFQQEQRALADRFSRPLADKISDYLQCIFGLGMRASVSFENNTFKTIHLIRSGSGGAMAFDILSGGAKEQVAAAVRLAIAELLAAEFGGTLPLVFDDAFAYSDPERVQTLQRMLDLGSHRGLQIIVLSCNPSDYIGLGARQIHLNPAPLTRTQEAEAAAAPREVDPPSPASETDTDTETFLSALRELGGKAGKKAMLERLGWEDSRYTQVKQSLVGAAKVVLGKGRGGSVSLP